LQRLEEDNMLFNMMLFSDEVSFQVTEISIATTAITIQMLIRFGYVA